MALYLRLLGTDPANPKIPVHAFIAIVDLQQRGTITLAQAKAAVGSASGSAADPKPLTTAEEAELATLVASVPTGTSAANQAARALRLIQIDHVLLAADASLPPLNTEAAIKSALGV